MKITLSLRNKTKNHFDTLLPEQREAVMNYMESFMALPEKEAFKEMVKLKISPEDVGVIKADILSRICGDICTNYQKLHAVSWLSDDAYPATLRNAFCDDKTLLALIKMRVSRRIDSPKPLDVARLQFLLNAKEERFRFGGLKELKFTDAEAKFFMNKTIAIAKYVGDIYSNTTAVKGSVPEVSEEIRNEAISEEVDSINEVHEETDPVAIPLSAANVIANADIIRNFLSDYDALEEKSEKIAALGIDPKEVLKNLSSVRLLLSAAANL